MSRGIGCPSTVVQKHTLSSLLCRRENRPCRFWWCCCGLAPHCCLVCCCCHSSCFEVSCCCWFCDRFSVGCSTNLPRHSSCCLVLDSGRWSGRQMSCTLCGARCNFSPVSCWMRTNPRTIFVIRLVPPGVILVGRKNHVVSHSGRVLGCCGCLPVRSWEGMLGISVGVP